MKTSELSGAALDWAVAKCEPDDKLAIYFDETTGEPLCHDDWPDNQEFRPSTNWAQGGAIIEREEIAVQCCYCDGVLDGWMADSKKLNEEEDMEQYGETPLIAAMRCYVASKLGDEIELPEELTNE